MKAAIGSKGLGKRGRRGAGLVSTTFMSLRAHLTSIAVVDPGKCWTVGIPSSHLTSREVPPTPGSSASPAEVVPTSGKKLANRAPHRNAIKNMVTLKTPHMKPHLQINKGQCFGHRRTMDANLLKCQRVYGRLLRRPRFKRRGSDHPRGKIPIY
jgi:hypothetical protein